MSSDWQTLADVWYRKREIYDMAWGDDSEMLRVCFVAGAPCGGPVACIPNQKEWQEVRGGMKPRIQIFTSAGKLISQSMWAHSGLIAMSWTSTELLACVFKDAAIRTFSVYCEMLHYFTVDETCKAEGVLMTSFWSEGVAILTTGCKIFVNSSFEKTACTQFVDFGLMNLPLSICVIPPPDDSPGDAQVLVATTQGPVLLCERERHRDIALEDGPYQTFALSPSGTFLACLSNSGLFKVLAVKDLSQLLDVANIECRKQPKQMVWVGNDCIALYLQIATPSNSFQHVLFVGGPQNDWIPYQYDYPVHLVSECDGCRIVGTQKCEFLQRVPTSTEAIYGVGSCEPPAMLCYALERFEAGDVRAEESLRAIKDELSDAINSCIDAASYEPDCATAQSLLKAAVFGRHFLNEKSSVFSKSFMETSRNLRICLALRGTPLEIPVTCTQLQEVGIPGMLTRLAQRRAHLLAVRICDWVGVSKDRVLIHWASVKIKHALSLTDEQLCTAIKQKFDACDGISYAEVAGVAAKAHRPNLAIMLLNNEPRGRDQVHLLLKLNEIGLAFEKACANGDPNLLHECLGTILALESEGIQKLVTMIKENPQVMQLASNVFVMSQRSTCKRSENYDKLQQVLERLTKHFQATQASILNAYTKNSVDDRVNHLKYSAQKFTHGEGTDAEKASMQFCATVSNDEATLLKMQEQYQADAVMKNWDGRDRNFLGLSLADTITKLIVMNQVAVADRLNEKMKMPEKRYCRIKVKALAKAQNFDELSAMAQLRTLPIGYEVIVEAFLSGDRKDMAAQFVPKIKSFELQAKYYAKMGMHAEAQAAYARKDERTGGLLSSMNIFSR